jgi:hypothetical protein
VASGAPSVEHLWKAYPLGERSATTPAAGTPPGTATAPRTQAVAAAARRRADAASPSAVAGGEGDDRKKWTALVVLALPLAAGAAWTVLRHWVIPAVRRRRRRAAARGQLRGGSARVAAPGAESPPSRRTARPAAGRGPAPPDPERRWLAEVRWDETAATPRFRVVARASEDGTEDVIAESGPVEWPPASPGAFRRMAEAAQALSDAVARAGWTPVARGEAWYAARYIWIPDEARPVGPEPPALWAGREPDARAGTDVPQRGAWPAETEALWRCEIRWRSGRTRSHFEAVARDPAGAARPVAGSDSLGRSTRTDPNPEDDRARAAVDVLRETLVADGWTRVEPGSPWYAERFVWRRDGAPPNHLDAATPSTAGRS